MVRFVNESLQCSTMDNSLYLQKAARLYIPLLKERLTAETFDKFKDVLDHVAESETLDRTMLLSEVKSLLSKHHDLIDNFRYFLYNLDHNRPSSVESSSNNGEEDIPLIPNKKSIETVKTSCVDFVNRVKGVLKDDDKFKSFITMVIGFERHKDVKRVEREAGFLFKEHPELKIEFSEFLAEANAGRTDQDIVMSEKRKRKEAETDGHKKWSDYETRMFAYEDGLHKKDLGYNTLLRAKEAAERLITDNLGNENLRETIWIAGYFRGQKFMKEDLKIRSELLSKKSMERGKAISKTEEFVRFLEKRINTLIGGWSEEKKRLAEMSLEEDLEIPVVFDWPAARRDVSESSQAEFGEVQLCSFSESPIHRALDLHSDSSSTTDCDVIRAFSSFSVKL